VPWSHPPANLLPTVNHNAQGLTLSDWPLQRHTETKLARALISGEVGEGREVTFTVKDDALVMR